MLDSILQNILDTMSAMSPWEVVAVILGFAYLALVMRQNSLGWYAAFGSTSIFIWLFWDASLPMESALNVFYLLIDRKSTRLNSSHVRISYAVFCLKKKRKYKYKFKR